MIKLQDFARQCGVTDRAIQKHLKTYAAELEGLFQRKGPNGTWLTDEACEILRSKMKQNPVVLVDTQSQTELEEAKARIEVLQEQRVELATQVAALAAWKAEKAVAIAEADQTRRLLDDAQRDTKLLEGFVADAKAEIAVLSDERDEAKALARQKEEAAQKAQDELTAAQARNQALEDYAAALEAWSSLSWLKRRRVPKPVAPEFASKEA